MGNGDELCAFHAFIAVSMYERYVLLQLFMQLQVICKAGVMCM